jgi:predicted AAA+ superfamily ATPase
MPQMDLRAVLVGMSAYKNITALPLMRMLHEFLSAMASKQGETALNLYTGLFYGLESEGYSALGDYLYDHLRYDAAPYPEAIAAGRADERLTRAAERDIQMLTLVANLPCAVLKNGLLNALPESWRDMPGELPEWEAKCPFTFEGLTEFYRQNGSGLFARYRAFVWEKDKLRPVEDPDYAKEEELFGYELQRNQVIENTRALVEGRAVNNVLLYGESGTGKSATVKSLLGVPGLEPLRIIEVDKENLGNLSELIRTLGHRPQKFIVFIDDLVFDKDDRTYSALKSILEGGLEKRPANVAVYATSNRRHLVRETFSDRAGDEVDANETIEEKTSLSDRFGLRIPYLALNQEQFLNLVYQLAEVYHIQRPREELKSLAIRWVMRHPGRSPRTARQFLNSLMV